MAKRSCYLEYHDDAKNSHKFWIGIVEGTLFTSKWGRIGNNAQTMEKPCVSEQEAMELYLQKYNEKIAKDYVDKTHAQPSSPSQTPQPFRYSLYWQMVQADGVVTREMAEFVAGKLASFTEACGTGRWEFNVVEGNGGPSFVITDVASKDELQFGFMPVEMSLTARDRRKHEESGINGFLSPSGFSAAGGVLKTDGLWMDLPARAMLALFRQECPEFKVFCDLRQDYDKGAVSLPALDHRSKFVWTPEWDNLEGVLDAHGLLNPEGRSSRRLKEALKQVKSVTVW